MRGENREKASTIVSAWKRRPSASDSLTKSSASVDVAASARQLLAGGRHRDRACCFVAAGSEDVPRGKAVKPLHALVIDAIAVGNEDREDSPIAEPRSRSSNGTDLLAQFFLPVTPGTVTGPSSGGLAGAGKLDARSVRAPS